MSRQHFDHSQLAAKNQMKNNHFYYRFLALPKTFEKPGPFAKGGCAKFLTNTPHKSRLSGLSNEPIMNPFGALAAEYHQFKILEKFFENPVFDSNIETEFQFAK